MAKKRANNGMNVNPNNTLAKRLETLEKGNVNVRAAQQRGDAEVRELETRIIEAKSHYENTLVQSGTNYSASAIVAAGKKHDDLVELYEAVKERLAIDFAGVVPMSFEKIG